MKLTLNLAVVFQLAATVGMASTYSVPVPTDLVDHSHWNISGHSSAKLTGSTLTVRYQLPADLVGEGKGRFQFTGEVGDSPFVNVKGSGVYGTCMQANGKPLTCMLKYPELAIDPTAVDQAIGQHFTGSEADVRKRVARLFSADPAGILSTDLVVDAD